MLIKCRLWAYAEMSVRDGGIESPPVCPNIARIRGPIATGRVGAKDLTSGASLAQPMTSRVTLRDHVSNIDAAYSVETRGKIDIATRYELWARTTYLQ